MRAVVFVGPSVPPDAVRAIVADRVETRPPVRRGDIQALYADGGAPPTHIGIIDGQFFQGLSISPKEILAVMDEHRARVYGAASMGALRAAELHPWGMIGVGDIFEMYRSGRVDADDEVAITYDEDTMRALCEPMVNMRVAFDAAVARGVVPAHVGALAVRTAKRLYFPDRTYRRVLDELAGAIPGDDHARLSGFLQGEDVPDAKRADGVALLDLMLADLRAQA
ncbi:TfuA-like protein [Thermopolyspora sp. NPDC052614]|uniref:TfuA-like protein n=1 Tax=Thermopolyspora sp. NPDC052614 TaxID=3155682 RepID=UPI0034411661